MPTYYDKTGQPIDVDRWCELFEDSAYKRVAYTEIDAADCYVSTVWLGLNHNWFAGPPEIFETMVFGGAYGGACIRYATETDAQSGHARTVAAVTAGRSPEETE